MNFESIKHVYLLGIGGIGMSALARYFHFLGKSVSGYDKTPSDLTLELEAIGIQIHYEDSVEAIPLSVRKATKSELLLIFTPAIPKDHQGKHWFIQQGFELYKRSQVLGLISEAFTTIAVAGTHGKTTTSTIAAHLLHSSKTGCSAFLGGISVNYQTNLLLANSPNLVVEADEFDRSFLTLSPTYSILTSTDADHLDIYGDADHVKQSYLDFTNKLRAGGRLLVRNGLDIVPKLTVPFYTYEVVKTGEEPSADFCGIIKAVADGAFVFDMITPMGEFKELVFAFPGRHNVENAVAAIGVSLLAGAEEQEIREALANFKGVRRRFEFQVRTNDCVYIDDYAHHPRELEACIKAVREIYPNRRITGIFQPHLFTRTRDFADGFAQSLDLLDDVLLMEIYPARELPIEGITSSWLLSKLKNNRKQLVQKEELLQKVFENKPEVLLTLGAGDIDRFLKPLAQLLG
jgi:UDP-N-acetylmuramate--alanine ligase